MPNIKSAKKRVKVISTKTLRNKMAKSSLRTTLKKANVAIETNAADKSEAVAAAVKALDRAVSKGLLHKNNVARKKSQIIAKLNKANA